ASCVNPTETRRGLYLLMLSFGIDLKTAGSHSCLDHRAAVRLLLTLRFRPSASAVLSWRRSGSANAKRGAFSGGAVFSAFRLDTFQDLPDRLRRTFAVALQSRLAKAAPGTRPCRAIGVIGPLPDHCGKRQRQRG